MQFYLTYVLGMGPTPENGWQHPKPQKKADKGTITHKALELLASKKLAIQERRTSFFDEESGQSFVVSDFDIDTAFKAAWQHYTTKLTHWDWTAADYKDCRKWVHDATRYNNGMFNPLNRHVIWPEKHFGFTIDEPWAAYSYKLPNGQKLQGQLGLKGTIDLVCRVDEDSECVELVDWKTGEKKDWATGKKKDYKSLRNDSQLRMYHYALSRLCPQAREIIITIVYIRDGGPFSLPFFREDLPETETMLRKRFEIIRECERPKLIKGDPVHGWKCSKLCTFGMNRWENGRKTVCDHVKNELLSLGIDRATAKYGDPKALTSYGSGGGQSAR